MDTWKLVYLVYITFVIFKVPSLEMFGERSTDEEDAKCEFSNEGDGMNEESPVENKNFDYSCTTDIALESCEQIHEQVKIEDRSLSKEK